MDVDVIDDVMADLADLEEERKQRGEIFANFAVEGNEDLEAELDELDRIMAEE